MEWLDNVWAVIGAGVGIFVSINLLFFKSDDFFSTKFKEDVSLRLLCVEPPDPNSSWPDLFIRLFDRIFEKQLNPKPDWRLYVSWPLFVRPRRQKWQGFVSWRTFLLSGVASFLAVAVVTMISLTVGPLSDAPFSSNWNSLFVLPLGALFVNVIPDYLSLLETRYLLRWLRGRPSAMRLIGLLIIDMVVTAAIFCIVGFFVFGTIPRIISGGAGSLIGDFLLVIQAYKEILWLKDAHIYLSWIGIFFYSTFFTSIWLWLFGLSQLVVTVASRAEPLLRVVKYVFPIDEKPFRSLGIIAGLIAMLGYWAFAAYQWAGSTIA